MDEINLQRQSSTNDELVLIEEFFAQLTKPKNLDSIRDKAREFCQRNSHLKIALVTVSGFYFLSMPLLFMCYAIYSRVVRQFQLS